MATNYKVLDGTDLLLSVGGKALGYSTSCKISTSTETGERITKEAATARWKEAYVKSFSETITADGLVLTNSDAEKPTYKELKTLQLAGEPIIAAYYQRASAGDDTNTIRCYGNFIITKLDIDATAGEDAKYSIELQSSGAVNVGTPSSSSLSE